MYQPLDSAPGRRTISDDGGAVVIAAETLDVVPRVTGVSGDVGVVGVVDGVVEHVDDVVVVLKADVEVESVALQSGRFKRWLGSTATQCGKPRRI